MPRLSQPERPFRIYARQSLMRGSRKPASLISPRVPLTPRPPGEAAPAAPAKPQPEPAAAREWRVIYRKPPTLLACWLGKNNEVEEIRGNTETQIDRLEMKYLVHPTKMVFLKDASEQMNLLEFIRLNKVIGGVPAIYVRYERECYAAVGKEYARITFDHGMRYRPALNSWVFPLRETKWYPMDSATAQSRDFSGYMLELKSASEVPHWMLECVERFNLVPAGHCKYSTAMNLEALFRGHCFSDCSEDTTPFENAAD